MLVSFLLVCVVATSVPIVASSSRWTDPVPACIWEGNVEIVNDVTLEECQEKCDSTTAFPCRSVEWSDSGLFAETCWMSNVTSADTAKYQRPCTGLFSNLLFSEKIEDPQDDVFTDISDSFVYWSCEFCTEASSALVSHSTSTSSLQDETELLVSKMCPKHPDPNSCRSSLPTFWAEYGKLIWSGFWALICVDQDCPSNDGVPEFWYRVAKTKTLATCSDCRERIKAHLNYLDGKTGFNKYQRKLPEFCDTQEDVEECNELGEWFAPDALTFLKGYYRQNADWITEICQLDLDCIED